MQEQIRNEQLTAVMTKLEGESGFLHTQNDTMVRKQEKLQVRQVLDTALVLTIANCTCVAQGPGGCNLNNAYCSLAAVIFLSLPVCALTVAFC